MSKQLWFAEYERLLNDYEDAGIPKHLVSDMAAEEARVAVRARLFDVADTMRKREREER